MCAGRCRAFRVVFDEELPSWHDERREREREKDDNIPLFAPPEEVMASFTDTCVFHVLGQTSDTSLAVNHQ